MHAIPERSIRISPAILHFQQGRLKQYVRPGNIRSLFLWPETNLNRQGLTLSEPRRYRNNTQVFDRFVSSGWSIRDVVRRTIS